MLDPKSTILTKVVLSGVKIDEQEIIWENKTKQKFVVHPAGRGFWKPSLL